MRYYLGPWVWSNTIGGSFNPPEGCISVVDLAPLPDQSITGSDRPIGFFAQPENLPQLDSAWELIATGDCREINSDNSMKSLFQSIISFRPNGDKLVDLLYDCLIDGSDVDGQTGPMPLVPTIDGNLELHLGGHSIVKTENFQFGKNHRHQIKIQQLLRRQFRDVHNVDPVHARRCLDWNCEKYRIDKGNPSNWRQLVPQDLHGHVQGPLPHSTSYSESFNTADSSTLGPDLTWTELSNVWSIVSNRAEYYSGSAQPARAEHSVSGTDQNCDLDCWIPSNSLIGPTVRFSASEHTNYVAWYYSSDSKIYLTKFVNAVQTNMTSVTISHTNGDTYRMQCNGSTLKGYQEGVERISLTDTSITDNLRGGMTGYGAPGGLNGDNFVFADISVAGPVAAKIFSVFQSYASRFKTFVR